MPWVRSDVRGVDGLPIDRSPTGPSSDAPARDRRPSGAVSVSSELPEGEPESKVELCDDLIVSGIANPHPAACFTFGHGRVGKNQPGADELVEVWNDRAGAEFERCANRSDEASRVCTQVSQDRRLDEAAEEGDGLVSVVGAGRLNVFRHVPSVPGTAG